MNQRSYSCTFCGEGVVPIHSSGALERLQVDVFSLQPLPGFIGHLEPLVLTPADDHGLRSLLDQFANVGHLDTGGMMRPGFVPVPTAAPSRPQLGISKVSDRGANLPPLQIIYCWGFSLDGSTLVRP